MRNILLFIFVQNLSYLSKTEIYYLQFNYCIYVYDIFLYTIDYS